VERGLDRCSERLSKLGRWRVEDQDRRVLGRWVTCDPIRCFSPLAGKPLSAGALGFIGSSARSTHERANERGGVGVVESLLSDQ
jgi:hypothetical protein